jgi:hypothetical protein
MTIETDNINPFETKGLTQKIPFLGKGKPKANHYLLGDLK